MADKTKVTGSSELKPQEEFLRLHGGIRNLMSTPLQIVDARGRLMAMYPCENCTSPAHVYWSRGEYTTYPETYGAVVVEALSAVEKCGTFNEGYIDLVRPTIDTTPIVAFWRECVRKHGAEVRNLPNMKQLRKHPGMTMYCVVSPYVALVAYFRYEEIDRLLVPALPMVGEEIGNQALMPAEQLILCSSVRR